MKSAEGRLYELLPAIYRIRDAEQGEPLKALISVIAGQLAVIEEDLAQLYDDQFIETCAPWVAPYIGDLIGYRLLHGVVPKISSPRAEVANTIGYRRRKGTVTTLEQLARDVTGWHAAVVEFFQQLATTQYMNHVRTGNRSPEMRRWEPLEHLNTAFDSLVRTADVRRIALDRGRYNIPNVGVFLWRLDSYRLTDVKAKPLKPEEAKRFFFSPLGNNMPLFTRPESIDEFSVVAKRINVPDRISRRTMREYFGEYYGDGKSLLVTINDTPVSTEQVVVCNLSDMPEGDAWAHEPPADKVVGIDPELGRMAFRDAQAQPPHVTFHHGFSADMGGGEYDRSATIPEEFTKEGVWQMGISGELTPIVGELTATLADAVKAWKIRQPKVGVISIMDSGSYDLEGVGAIEIPAGRRLLIVAAKWPEITRPDGSKERVAGRFNAADCRPDISGNLSVQGAGNAGGRLYLNGVLLEGFVDVSAGRLEQLSMQHCTLVPGRSLSSDGSPTSPGDPSLVVSTAETRVEIGHSITGGLRVAENVELHITNSIVDATSSSGVAFSALDGRAAGGTLRIENTTVIGKVHTALMELATNTIFFSRLAERDDWAARVWCERRQSGCIRFSFVPLGSITPRRYQCQPPNNDEAAGVTPHFTSLSYGEPGYAQLSQRCRPEIFSGADDESEMGAFHDLYQPQRIANVRLRLDEYLRFGLEAGIIYAT